MQKSKRKKTSYRRRIIIALAVFGTLCLIFIGTSVTILILSLSQLGTPQSFALVNHGCLGTKPYQISTIESRAEFELPSSAQNLFAYSVAFQDCVVFISFEMDSVDLEALLDSTYVNGLEPKDGDQLTSFISFLQNDVDWTFEDNRSYLYGIGQHPEGLETQQIVIDEISPLLYKVYIVTFLM